MVVYKFTYMYYPRLIEPKIIDRLAGKEAIIVTGMRRVGKTTVLRHIYDTLPDNKTWFDFENPLDSKYFEDVDYNDIYEKIIQREGLDRASQVYVFIDEVQHFPEISKIVKYLIDHYGVKFVLTGSASYYLKNLFPESLAGRKVVFEMFPLDFSEFLHFKQEDSGRYAAVQQKAVVAQTEYELYDMLYQEYVTWGGFPEVVLETNQERKQERLTDIFSSYYQQEVLGLADYRKGHAVRDLISLLAARAGSQLDLTKISQELGITRTTLYSYLSFLQDTYFIHLISPLSGSIDREVSGRQKIYFCDNGLLQTVARVTEGQLLENAVYNQLKQRGKINYWRSKSGTEVDFILDKTVAYEVKKTASPIDVKRLDKAIELAKVAEGYVASQSYVEDTSNRIKFAQFLWYISK